MLKTGVVCVIHGLVKEEARLSLPKLVVSKRHNQSRASATHS